SRPAPLARSGSREYSPTSSTAWGVCRKAGSSGGKAFIAASPMKRWPVLPQARTELGRAAARAAARARNARRFMPTVCRLAGRMARAADAASAGDVEHRLASRDPGAHLGIASEVEAALVGDPRVGDERHVSEAHRVAHQEGRRRQTVLQPLQRDFAAL